MPATLGILKDRLNRWVNRSDPDFLDNRVLWINQGIRWIQRGYLADTGVATQWTNATDLLTGVSQIPVPPEYRPAGDPRAFRMDGAKRVPLRRIRLEWLEEPFLDLASGEEQDFRDTSVRGVPGYFAIRGRFLEIRPIAQQAYTIELHATMFLEELVNDDDENLLTCEAEDACLYAALRECWQFFEDVGRADYWEGKATVAMIQWGKDRASEASAQSPLVMQAFG